MIWKILKNIFLKQKACYIQSQAFQWVYCNVIKTAETLKKTKKTGVLWRLRALTASAKDPYYCSQPPESLTPGNLLHIHALIHTHTHQTKINIALIYIIVMVQNISQECIIKAVLLFLVYMWPPTALSYLSSVSRKKRNQECKKTLMWNINTIIFLQKLPRALLRTSYWLLWKLFEQLLYVLFLVWWQQEAVNRKD